MLQGEESPRPASGGGGETWQELTVWPRSAARARLPSPSPGERASRPAPRPAAAEAAFQELSRNPPHVTVAPAAALKRLRR